MGGWLNQEGPDLTRGFIGSLWQHVGSRPRSRTCVRGGGQGQETREEVPGVQVAEDGGWARAVEQECV